MTEIALGVNRRNPDDISEYAVSFWLIIDNKRYKILRFNDNSIFADNCRVWTDNTILCTKDMTNGQGKIRRGVSKLESVYFDKISNTLIIDKIRTNDRSIVLESRVIATCNKK